MNIDFIYFLTTDKDKKRYDNCLDQIHFLANHNIFNVGLVLNSKFPDTYDWQLTQTLNLKSGALSCLYGHYSIMKKALFYNQSIICICEDDILLTDRFVDLYFNFHKYCDFQFDCLKLHNIIDDHINEEDIFKKYINKYFYLLKRNDVQSWSTACYIINRDMMADYISYLDNTVTTVDNYFNQYDNNKFNLYFTDYRFVQRQNYDTTI